MSEHLDASSAGQWSGTQMEGFSALADRVRQLALPYLDHTLRHPLAEDYVLQHAPGAALLQLARAFADDALRRALHDPYAGDELAAWRPDLLSQEAWHFAYNLALTDLADDAMTRIIAIRRATRPIRAIRLPSQSWHG